MFQRSLLGLILICFSQYLFAQEPNLIVPSSHFGPLAGMNINSNGTLVLTRAGGEEIGVKLWDAETGRLLRTLNAHTGQITSSSFSPDGKYIITTGVDQAARIWLAESGALVYDIHFELSNQVQQGYISKNNQKILLVAEFGMEYHDLPSKKRISVVFDSSALKAGSDAYTSQIISSAAFHPDGNFAVTTHTDSTIRIWNLANNKILFRIKDTAPLGLCQFSHNGRYFMASGFDGYLRIWETASGKLVNRYAITPGISPSAIFTKDDSFIWAASTSGSALQFDVLSGKKVKELTGHTGMMVAVQLSKDDKYLLTTSLDGTARLWETQSGNTLRIVAETDTALNNGKKEVDESEFSYIHAAFSENSDLIFSSIRSNKVNVQETGSGKKISSSIGINTVNLEPHYSQDGKWISTTGISSLRPLRGYTKIWDAKTGKMAHLLRGHTGVVNDVLFHPNGKWVITMSEDSTAKVWDLANETILYTFGGHEKGVYKGYLTGKGDYLITQTFSGSVRIWNLEEGKMVTQVKNDSARNYESGVWSITLSPKNKYFKVVYYDGLRTEIRETATGKLLHSFEPQTDSTAFFHFDAADDKLYYAEKKSARILSLNSGQEIFRKELKNKIARFNPDPSGKYFVIQTFFDNSLEIWDSKTLKILPGPGKQQSLAQATEFTSDGRLLVCNYRDTVKVWSLPDFTLQTEYRITDNEYLAFILTRSGKDYLFCRTYEGALYIRELSSGKLLAKLDDKYNSNLNYPIDPTQPRFIIDNKFSTDIYTLGSSLPLLRIIPVGEEDYLLIDSAGHFDGTANARKLLYFTCGTEIIELEQVKDKLWVPDLAERLLKNETINTPGLQYVNICNLTPITRNTRDKSNPYRYEITPRKGGLGETIVLVNGIEIKRVPKQKLTPLKNSFELKLNAAVIEAFFVTGSPNTVEVKALTSGNDISSRGAVLVANPSSPKNKVPPPSLYAVVVGVSEYKGTELDLEYAHKDAEDFANALRKSASKFLNTDTSNNVFIYKLHTGSTRDLFPEKNAVKKTILEIGKKARPNDILLIFFAGHGKWDQTKNQFFFLTAEASSFSATEGAANAGISMQELSDWIQPSLMKAQKRILIFDACNSGQAIKDLVKIGNEKQKYTAARSDDKAQQIKSIEKLNNKSGLFILSASAGNQSAYEMGRYAQGLLTYSLLKAIKEEPDILEEQKFLNVSRWFNTAEKTVSNLAAQNGNQQEPQLVSTTNFNIGLVDDEVRASILLPNAKPIFAASNFQNSDEAADGDDIELSKEVNRKLNDLAARGSNTSILFVAGTTASDAYSLTGRYDVKGSEITVRVVIRQGKEIKTRFEVKGLRDKLDELASQIAEKAGSALQP